MSGDDEKTPKTVEARAARSLVSMETPRLVLRGVHGRAASGPPTLCGINSWAVEWSELVAAITCRECRGVARRLARGPR